MNEKQWEQLSALVDGEFHENPQASFLSTLAHDEELRSRWARYHLVSDALRNHLADTVAPDFSERVAKALENEPVVLAPRRRLLAGISRKPLAGVAAAAAVALVAVLTIRSIPPEAEPGLTVATAQPAPVRVENNLPPSVSTSQPRLSGYLVNHNEYSVSSGMQGMLPYMRVVSHPSRAADESR